MGRTITQIIMIKKRLLLWEIRLTLREQFSSENGRMELKNFYVFLELMPDDENIILSDNDVEESAGGVFKIRFIGFMFKWQYGKHILVSPRDSIREQCFPDLNNKKHIFIEYKGDCNEQQGKWTCFISWKGFKEGNQCETLLSVTGSGKTFTMANVI